MNKLSRSILIVLICFFAYAEAASNKVSFGSISELTSGNLRIVFKLEQVALINSYALDDPSRIVIDIKNTRLIIKKIIQQILGDKDIKSYDMLS